MKDFYAHIPTKLYFGENKFDDFISALSNLGKNILIVTGGGSIKKLGFYDPLISKLQKLDLGIFEFQGIEANPLAQTIDKCAKDHKNSKIDIVLAFGGGSVMDAAKAISALLYLSKQHELGRNAELPIDIWSYVLGSPLVGKLPGALPICTIPTTAATASEVTPYSVISNDKVIGKSPLSYEFLKPALSFLNPVYTTCLPKHTTQDGAADILSHVFENYLLGGNGAIFTDRYCEAIIKTVIETLPQIIENPEDINLRGDLLWCSTLALNGFHSAGRNTSQFPLHAIEHAMSAFKHELAHGRGLATLFPAYFRYLWNKNLGRDRLNRLGEMIFDQFESNEMSGLYFIEKFENWLESCDLLQSAYSLGFNDNDFEVIASYAARIYGDGDSIDVLGKMTTLDIEELLKLTKSQDRH
ncbi:MAG TPA: iron-containing alcohol dehydrogenase [Oligoflexia bacterium]|nr:iron-containing alcohol dehydrogenase [Oligoflexia bacterium]HMP48706.1 iron-containing alcohol dehydrogenase [Oligoflexia bacterium]